MKKSDSKDEESFHCHDELQVYSTETKSVTIFAQIAHNTTKHNQT